MPSSSYCRFNSKGVTQILSMTGKPGQKSIGVKLGDLVYENDQQAAFLYDNLLFLTKSYNVLGSQNTTVFKKWHMEYLYYQLHVSASTLGIIRSALTL